MPSPQSLVVFVAMLFAMLLVARVQLGLGPNVAAGVSLVVAFLLAWAVDRRIPPDEDDEEQVDDAVASSGTADFSSDRDR